MSDPDGRAGRERVSLLERLTLVLVALVIMLLRLLLLGPVYSNDSYQYLSIAENLDLSGSVTTSLISFDAERSYGTIPAPVTTFPPGYAAAIRAVTAAPVSGETAGILLSLVAVVGLVVSTESLAIRINLPAASRRIVVLLIALNSQVILLGTSVLSDALFAAMALGGVALTAHQSPRHKLLGAALIGLSGWIRYAGIFFVIGLYISLLLPILRSKHLRASGRISADRLLPLIVSSLIAAGPFVRNVIDTGALSGENTLDSFDGIDGLLYRIAGGTYFLIFGRTGSPTSLPHVLFVAVALIAAVSQAPAIVRAVAQRRHQRHAIPDPPVKHLVSFLVVYLAGLAASDLFTATRVSSRLLVPVLPLALLLGAHLWSSAAIGELVPKVVVRVGLVGLLAANLVALAWSKPHPHERVAGKLDPGTGTQVALTDWVERNVAEDDVLLAQDGQATGYYLQRAVVSTVGQTYSTLTWTERETCEVMTTFGIEYLVVYRGAPSDEYLDSEFLEGLGDNKVPAWLEVAASNDRAVILREVLPRTADCTTIDR